MGGVLIFLAVVLLAVGIASHMWVRKRAFERTNAYGTQEFDGYGKMVKATSVEYLAKVVSVFAFIGAFLFFFVGMVASR